MVIGALMNCAYSHNHCYLLSKLFVCEAKIKLLISVEVILVSISTVWQMVYSNISENPLIVSNIRFRVSLSWWIRTTLRFVLQFVGKSLKLP